MYINLSGLVVLVTGASRGIGKSIAQKLAEAGATIAVHCYKEINDAEEVARVIGNDSMAFQADFSNFSATEKLFETVEKELGSVDAIINNATNRYPSDFLSKKEMIENWNDKLNINLISTSILCQKSIEHFKNKKKIGRVINIISQVEESKIKDNIAFECTQASIKSLTSSLSKTYKEEGLRIFTLLLKAESNHQMNFERKENKNILINSSLNFKNVAPLVAFIVGGMVDNSSGSIFEMSHTI